MKVYRILRLSAVLVLTPLAVAKLPLPNNTFGRIEGTLDACAQADPSAAAQYEERKKALVAGLPEKELSEARATQEYRDAYEATTAEIGKQPKDRVVEACSAFLRGNE